jgi:hypothetical protein
MLSLAGGRMPQDHRTDNLSATIQTTEPESQGR